MVLGHTRGYKYINQRKKIWLYHSHCNYKLCEAMPVSKFQCFWVFTITNDQNFTKKLCRVEKPILKLWWKFRWNSFVSYCYWDKNLQTFSEPLFVIYIIFKKVCGNIIVYNWQIMVLGHTKGCYEWGGYHECFLVFTITMVIYYGYILWYNHN